MLCVKLSPVRAINILAICRHCCFEIHFKQLNNDIIICIICLKPQIMLRMLQLNI